MGDTLVYAVPETLVYTVPETKGLLKIAESRVWALIKSGELESITIAGTNTRRVPRSALIDYVERLRREQNSQGSAA